MKGWCKLNAPGAIQWNKRIFIRGAGIMHTQTVHIEARGGTKGGGEPAPP